MWWLWPHFKRLWAAAGTLGGGLLVNYIFALAGRQSVPTLRDISSFLYGYWYLTSGLLAVFAIASIIAERAYRQHEARAPRPLQIVGQRRRGGLFGRLKRHPEMQSATPSPPATASTIVGRATELAQLTGWFAEVKGGARRIIFVSGEPGIGKTTLTREFLASLSHDRTARIGRGQCVEQYGAGEPYMPILEALTRLCRKPGGEKLVEILHRMAPAWLAQMPSLVTAEDRTRLQGLAQGTTQQRMLREMAEALEVIAVETTLVLLLEDLHWSDPSTLDLIATVARRAESARLMILGTYRPVEVLTGEHPLRAMKEELQLHQHCIELRLPLLSEGDVATYLAQRFTMADPQPAADGRPLPIHEAAPSSQLAPAIYARSEGNPLFMVNVVDYLVEQGSLAEADKIEAPRNIRQMIERNLRRLSPDEQRILEAASVAGAEFSAASVAAALDRPVADIDACCTGFAKREQFLTRLGASTWPDGTSSTGFRFQHALYLNVLYDAIPESHRVGFHRHIADRLEAAYDGRVREIAAELANHYNRATEADKGSRYHQLAAEQAAERRAYREAEQHYRNALAMLHTLPESAERDRRELPLQLALANVMQATQGWSSSGTTEAYTRARQLAERGGSESLEVLYGLHATISTRGDLHAAAALADKILEVAHGAGASSALCLAHYLRASTHSLAGELMAARGHFQRAVDYYHEEDFLGTTHEPGVGAYMFAGHNEWHLGYPDRGLGHVEKALAIARRLNNKAAVAFVLSVGSMIHEFRGDFERALAAAIEATTLGTDFGLLGAIAKGRRAYARLRLGESADSLEDIRQTLAEFNAANFYLTRDSVLIYLAEAQAHAGELVDALATVEEALFKTNTDSLLYKPELFRIRGELRLRTDAADQRVFELAEQDFRKAIELTHDTEARSCELRATMSLARLLRDTGRRDEARTMLTEIYGWFTEGFDTADLKEAKALLDELTEVPG